LKAVANRQLTKAELETLFRPVFEDVRARLRVASGGDEDLHWALRRKLTKELSYAERGKPMLRKVLKALKRGEQGGKCALCHCELPERNAVLDRLEAMKGYTAENTRLLCQDCDQAVQVERGFA
jgi:ribosomal protein L44E